MRGIVQYEVYILDEGRWTLCARYPGAQREAAIQDASSTEGTTGRATKVVRDTYFPESNQNEEITTYISPKGRALQAILANRRKFSVALRRDKTAHATGSRRAPPPKRQQMRKATRAELVIRVIVAFGVSIVMATIFTSVVSLILTRIAPTAGISAPSVGTLLAITYGLVFLVMVPRAMRARWRLHQVILELWENSGGKAPAPVLRPRVAKQRRALDGFRPWDVARFDPAPPPPVLEPVTAESITLDSPPPAPVPPAPPPPQEAAKTQPPKVEEKKPAEPKKAEVAAAPPVPVQENSLEAILLRRFAVDVVMPALTRTQRDDPVTRRGAALIVAGAVEGLADTANINDARARSLLTDALTHIGTKPASIEVFLDDYTTHIAAPNAQPLLSAGRVTIKKYSAGKSDLQQSILDALAVWRFPSLVRTLPRRIVAYLLSELRGVSPDDPEAALYHDLHDMTARAKIAEHGGRIVPHGEQSVFARFDDEPSAAAAAEDIRRAIADAEGPPVATAIAVRSHLSYEDEDAMGALAEAQTTILNAETADARADDAPFKSSFTSTSEDVTAPKGAFPQS